MSAAERIDGSQYDFHAGRPYALESGQADQEMLEGNLRSSFKQFAETLGHPPSLREMLNAYVNQEIPYPPDVYARTFGKDPENEQDVSFQTARDVLMRPDASVYPDESDIVLQPDTTPSSEVAAGPISRSIADTLPTLTHPVWTSPRGEVPSIRTDEREIVVSKTATVEVVVPQRVTSPKRETPQSTLDRKPAQKRAATKSSETQPHPVQEATVEKRQAGRDVKTEDTHTPEEAEAYSKRLENAREQLHGIVLLHDEKRAALEQIAARFGARDAVQTVHSAFAELVPYAAELKASELYIQICTIVKRSVFDEKAAVRIKNRQGQYAPTNVFSLAEVQRLRVAEENGFVVSAAMTSLDTSDQEAITEILTIPVVLDTGTAVTKRSDFKPYENVREVRSSDVPPLTYLRSKKGYSR